MEVCGLLADETLYFDLSITHFQKFNACEEYVLDFFIFQGVENDFAFSSHCDNPRRFQIFQLVGAGRLI